MLGHPAPTWRDHPVLGDRLLAVGLGVAGEVALWVGGAPAHTRSPDTIAAVLVLVQTLPLAWRRQHPDRALRIIGAATVVGTIARYPTNLDAVSALIALYSFAAHRPSRSQAWPAVVAAAAVIASIAWVDLRSDRTTHQADYAWAAAVFTMAWVVGNHLRSRRADAATLAERVERAERDRVLEAQRAVAEERARIARELHDVVAHALGMIAMQAGGAERVADLNPADAKEILRSVAETSREALGEMRRMVGVLRNDEDGAELAPQPSVADLGSLVDHVRSVGLDTSLRVEGAPRGVPTVVELSAYRIVQEALTNTLKHAGPARAQVIVRWRPNDVELEVIDDGRGAAAWPVIEVELAGVPALGAREAEPGSAGRPNPVPGRCNGDGHGLIGMRERVSMLGGDLAAGPRPGGGFGVRARLPLGT